MPDVSPNKTIEGALGGILSAVVVAALFLVSQLIKGYFLINAGDARIDGSVFYSRAIR